MPCSLGLSATSQQYFSLTTNQPLATSQQYSSLRRNQHQPSATSQPNRLIGQSINYRFHDTTESGEHMLRFAIKPYKLENLTANFEHQLGYCD
jgi:hypothetical protein